VFRDIDLLIQYHTPDLTNLRSPSITYSFIKDEEFNGTSKVCVPLAVNLKQFAVISARQQFVSSSTEVTTDITDNNNCN